MEIKTQITEAEANKIAFIQQKTNKDISEILKLAINLYYNHLQTPLEPSLQILEQSGFIGCCSVENDLSTTYKSVLSNQLNQKYDHR
jgi:predicted metal-dependent hydrolase